MRFLMGTQPATGNLVTRTVVDFAYESVAGASIAAGVPAPGALALLGVAGLAGARRRR
jgi:MYXO-CTERM domain-containing protein